MTPIQKLIRERMDALSITTYAELGRHNGAGLHRSVVKDWATEPKRSLPQEDTVRAFARALEVPEKVIWDAAYQSVGSQARPEVRRGDRMVPVVGDLESMSDLDLLKLQEAVTAVQEAINQEQRRRHERSQT